MTNDEPAAAPPSVSPLAKILEEKLFEEKNFKHHGEITRTLSYFDTVQRNAGILGGTGEIGVFDGAFFVPLALCCREDEISVAIDVFDLAELNWNPRGGLSSLAKFKKIVNDVVGSDDRVRYIEGDSLYLTPSAIRSETNGHGFRLFSIDGAHSVHHTVSDLKLIGEVTNPGGVVMLDDIKNWGWPGVINGFARYMLLGDFQRLVPFFLYGNKLLLTTPSHQQFYLQKTTELAKQYGRAAEMNGGYRISEFFGFQVLGWN